MDKFDAMQCFVAVVREGGFSAASRALGQPVATVSRKVAQLEQALGLTLLRRSTRHVALSSAGERYFQDCERLLELLQTAEASASGEFRAPRGRLLLTAPLGFGRLHVMPVVREFLRAYPEIQVEVQLTDRLVPIIEEHVDCAVRINALPDSGLVAKPLGQVRRLVCAAPSYLAVRGEPQHPADLRGHDCIAWAGGAQRTWDFRLREGGSIEAVPVHARLVINASEAAVEAARDGLGLVQATCYQLSTAFAAGELVPVLRSFEQSPTPVSLVYAERGLVAAKLRAFVDFAAVRLRERLDAVASIWSTASPPTA